MALNKGVSHDLFPLIWNPLYVFNYLTSHKILNGLGSVEVS